MTARYMLAFLVLGVDRLVLDTVELCFWIHAPLLRAARALSDYPKP